MLSGVFTQKRRGLVQLSTAYRIFVAVASTWEKYQNNDLRVAPLGILPFGEPGTAAG